MARSLGTHIVYRWMEGGKGSKGKKWKTLNEEAYRCGVSGKRGRQRRYTESGVSGGKIKAYMTFNVEPTD